MDRTLTFPINGTQAGPPPAARPALEVAELERLAREVHRTAFRLGETRLEWNELEPAARRQYLERAAIAFRLGNTGARNLALERGAAILATAIARLELPVGEVEAYTLTKRIARDVRDEILGWLSR